MYENAADELGLPPEVVRSAAFWAEWKLSALRRPNGKYLSRQEARLASLLAVTLEKQQRYVIDGLAGLTFFRQKGVRTTKDLGQELNLLLDNLPESERLVSRMMAYAGIVMLKGARTSIRKYGLGSAGIEFNLTNQGAVRYLEALKDLHLSQRHGSINLTTRRRIIEVVREGAADGVTYAEMAKRIRELGTAGVFSPARAELIAVREIANAYEFGNLQPVREFQQRTGQQAEKAWQTVGDEKVTDGCRQNEAKGWLLLNEPFPSGDDSAPRGGNPRCRCATVYRFR